MNLRNILLFIGIILIISCNEPNSSGSKSAKPSPEHSWFNGVGNVQYNAVAQTFTYEAVGKNAFLRVQDPMDIDNISLESPGSHFLKYAGKYTVELIQDGKAIGKALNFHKVNHDGVRYLYQYNFPNEPISGISLGKLNDGMQGPDDPKDPTWLSWKNQDVEILVDLGARVEMGSFEFSYYEDLENNIYPPSSILIDGSYRGDVFQEIRVMRNVSSEGINRNRIYNRIGTDFRFYKFRIANYNGSKSLDKDCYLMLDEIIFKEAKKGTPAG